MWHKLLNRYGKGPFKVALIHGGPGAVGEMSPVAEELSSLCGILEPLQNEKSIEAELSALKSILEKEADLPVVLVGFSWGAWLSYIFAAEYPLLVKKLILIGSAPFEEKYIQNLMEIRSNHLTEAEKIELSLLLENLKDPAIKNKNIPFQRLGLLLSKADAFDPIIDDSKTVIAQYDIYDAIWKQARELRASGKLLELGKKIECPVTAIHGDHDPHDSEGVKKTLSETLKQFRFVLLQECGHCPWIERRAKEKFYALLKKEIL